MGKENNCEYFVNNKYLSFSKVRVLNGYSQKALAKELGVSPLSVFNWEAGKGRPSPENVLKLSSIFRCEVDDILNILKDGGDVTCIETQLGNSRVQKNTVSYVIQLKIRKYLQSTFGENTLK